MGNNHLELQLSLILDDLFIKCSEYDEKSLIKTDWGKIPPEWKNIDFGELIQIASGDRPDEKSETKTAEFNIPLFGASKIDTKPKIPTNFFKFLITILLSHLKYIIRTHISSIFF